MTWTPGGTDYVFKPDTYEVEVVANDDISQGEGVWVTNSGEIVGDSGIGRLFASKIGIASSIAPKGEKLLVRIDEEDREYAFRLLFRKSVADARGKA